MFSQFANCKATSRLLRPEKLTREKLSIKLSDDEKRFTLRVLNRDGHNYTLYQWANRFPERRQSGFGNWIVAATDFSALIIHFVWEKHPILRINPASIHNHKTTHYRESRLVFESQEAELKYRYLLMRLVQQNKRAVQKANYKEHKVIPPYPKDYLENPELPLSDYQKVALFTCLETEASALFMEQGTGKTPIPIRRISIEGKRKKKMYRALIVCPKAVRQNWIEEFHRFATSPGKVTVLRGGKLKRVKLLIESCKDYEDVEWSAVICSYEAISTTLEAFSMIPWDLVVLDESHFIKSKRTQRFQSLIKIRNNFKSKMLLTGTPVTKLPQDLWTQFEILGEGLSGFQSYENFARYYQRTIPEGRYEVVVGLQNMPILHERINRLAFIISKKEALPDLPQKVYDQIECSMTPKQREYYQTVATRLAIEIEDELKRSENKQMTVNSILTKLLRLAQITSGFMKWDDSFNETTGETTKGRVEYFKGNPKILALLDEVKASPVEEKIIVWACFIPDIRAISASLEANGIKHVTLHGANSDEERLEAQRAFNEDPDVKVLVGNPTVGGTGLNLRGYTLEKDHGKSCSRVIYYSQNWSMTARVQSEDRAHRRGTRVQVRYTDIVVPGTIDEEIRHRVLAKKEIALGVQDVRDIVKAIAEKDIENGE